MARQLTAEEHSVGLAANAIRWLLENGEFSHPGLKSHLIAAETQLVACRALLEVAPRSGSNAMLTGRDSGSLGAGHTISISARHWSREAHI